MKKKICILISLLLPMGLFAKNLIQNLSATYPSESLIAMSIKDSLSFYKFDQDYELIMVDQGDSSIYQLNEEQKLITFVFRDEKKIDIFYRGLWDTSIHGEIRVNICKQLLEWNFEKQNSEKAFHSSSNKNAEFKRIPSNISSTYPRFGAHNSEYSVSTNRWENANSVNAWEVFLSTKNYKNILLSSAQKSSDSGPKNFKLFFRLSASSPFQAMDLNRLELGNDNFIKGKLNYFYLPPELNNKDSVWIQWRVDSNIAVNGKAISSAGTSRIDNILFYGDSLVDIPRFAFEKREIIVEEKDSILKIPVLRLLNTSSENTLKIKLSGDADSSDYFLNTTELIFQKGDSVLYLELKLINDSIKEEEETIKLLLLSEGAKAFISKDSVLIVKILKNDYPSSISFIKSDLSIIEADTLLQIPIRVKYSITGIDSIKFLVRISHKSSAELGSDYLLMSDSIFNIQKIQSDDFLYSLQIKSDSLKESDEIIRLELIPLNNCEWGIQKDFELTIKDKEIVGISNINAQEFIIYEAESSLVIANSKSFENSQSLVITDYLGRIQFEKKMTEQEMIINKNLLPNGLLVIYIYGEQGIYSKKIIVQ